jgi:predicted Fe-S protein YdhL (DUF1289 family)
MRDLDTVFDALATSAFRRRFALGVREARYLRERGVATLVAQAHDLIGKRLAPQAPLNDGRQTPFRGHPVFIAQHATATCCRSCLEKWHGIAANKVLDEAERRHVVAAIERWLREQPAAQEAASAPAVDDPQRKLPF